MRNMEKNKVIELIIDRIGNINIFNIIKDDDIPVTGDFKTTVDDDLVNEYIEAVDKLYNVFLAEAAGNKNNHSRLDELKNISHEFFKQLFPEPIQKYLAKTKIKYLFVKPDEALSHLPWELLYDGNKFLSQNFYFGRGTKCDYSPANKNTLTKPFNMLIIVDPTGTLAWANFEMENLKSKLIEKLPSTELKIEVISSKNLSKLKLMNTMRGQDIIHFIGHSIEDKEDIENSGWKIGNDKLLKVREIAKSNISPVLVFSHSCKSANSIASAFLEAGVKHFVGCRHDVLESKHVIEFASKFYEDIFSSIPIGKAFKDAVFRNKQSNILSFNYVLYSNPKKSFVTFQSSSKAKSYIKPEEVLKLYPYPISETYRKFLVAQKKKNYKLSFEELSTHLLYIIKFFSFFALEELHRHSIDIENLSDILEHPTLKHWKEFLYKGLSELINLRQDLEIPKIAAVFYLQKENIEKCIDWINEYYSENLSESEIFDLITVFQYLVETLVIDLSFITRYELFYFLDDGSDGVYNVINLRGTDKKIIEKELNEIYESHQTILYDPIEGNMVLDLSGYFTLENEHISNNNVKVKMLNAIHKDKKTFEQI